MERAIRAYLREQEMRGNITLATLLDDLYLNGQEEVASDVENAMERHGLSSSTRVDTLLQRVSEEEEEESEEPMESEVDIANEGNGDDEEGSEDDEDDE